jgi:hypothetical protein
MKAWNWTSSVRLPVDLALAFPVFAHLNEEISRERGELREL